MAKRWYVVHVYSGFETKVADEIRRQATSKGMEDAFEEILIPTQEVVELKRGQKVNSEKNVFPGYVMIKMDMNDEAWHLVKDTPRVTGFLGTGKRPVPMSDREAERMIKQVEEGIEKPKSLLSFDVGEQVKVCDGPFNSFNGVVEEVDEDRERLKVSVSIFGRETPVELEFTQVEKQAS